MTSKKPNSGGKKFQDRLPNEPEVNVAKKKKAAPRYNDKPSDFSRNSRGTSKSRDDRSGYGDDRPKSRNSFSDTGKTRQGSKRAYTGNEDRGTFKKRDERSGFGDDRPKSRNSYSDTGKPRAGSKRAFTGNEERGKERKSFTPYNSEERGTFKKRSFSGPEKPYAKKRFSNPEDAPRGRKPMGDDKPYRSNTGRPAKPYGKKSGFGSSDPRKSNEAPVSKKYFKESNRGPQEPANYKGRGKSFRKATENLATGKLLQEQEEVRLNRYIANSGLCSRREADVMIDQGLVKLNGEVVTQLGIKIKPGDDVRVDGKRINPEKPVYILLNKPKGYITSTSDPDDRATVMDLIDLPGKERIYPVGRLDRNTTGVLLLTNDGELAQKLMHPSFEIRKIYKARLDKKPSKEHMLDWVSGVTLEDGPMAFEQIGFVDEEDQTTVGLEVHSGRNRIVRRMFEHFGYEVISLDRVMLGDFDHLKLGRGKWRFLNEKEILYVERLKRAKGKSR